MVLCSYARTRVFLSLPSNGGTFWEDMVQAVVFFFVMRTFSFGMRTLEFKSSTEIRMLNTISDF
ncbi:uncharacterized protein DS421_17g589540 [Arachis hypogaea]|nr:uncharacterized protein DS421_17g589540 [Arachis hypogaea]